jgi:nicotinamidase-related amidase
MEMRASIELQFWTNNDGEFGEPVLQVIANDSELTARQKANDMEVFRTRIWSSTTRGSWCNPTTGALVYPDNSGNYPEGSVTQLTFWQSLPHGAFAGTTLAEKVYAALLVNMQQIYDLDNI